MKEFIENFLTPAISILGCWAFISIVLNLTLYFSGLRKKILWVIKIPKQKKYLTKVDPIYQMSYANDYWSTGYFVYKWSLTYDDIEDIKVWCAFLIPYPITIQTFKYRIEDKYFLCKENEVNQLDPDISLEMMFNERHEKWLIKKAEEKLVEKNKTDLILSKNQIFKENYE